MAKIINVAVLIYPWVELIDMNGPLDVFIKANYGEERYRVFTVAESAGAITSERSAVTITPQYTLSNCPPTDIIVIPGQVMPAGSPTMFGGGSEQLIDWIIKRSEISGTIIMSVCVGIYILANTGLLNGKNATTHWDTIKEGGIEQQYPDIKFIKNKRYVADGNIISTGGVTSGIDGALYLVSVNYDPKTALHVADIMVYTMQAPLPSDTILH